MDTSVVTLLLILGRCLPAVFLFTQQLLVVVRPKQMNRIPHPFPGTFLQKYSVVQNI